MYYFIVNPNAHAGKSFQLWKHIRKQLEYYSVEYEAHLTSYPGEAAVIARELTANASTSVIIVVVGGDGTVNEVVNGLDFHAQITLGHIPAGSANDLAKSLKISSNYKKALKHILNPQYHKLLDYGILTYEEKEPCHRRFVVSCGVGLDAAVCSGSGTASVIWKKTLDKLRLSKLYYFICGCREFMAARPVKGYLILDGERRVEFNHVYFISVHIHPYEGGGFRFAPKADYADGKLSICVMSNRCKRRIIPAMYNAFSRRPKKARGGRYYECQEAEIHMEQALPMHADGEKCNFQKDLHVRCVRKKIRMIV